MLLDRVDSCIGKAISLLLIVTTQSLVFSFAYADTRFDETVQSASSFAQDVSGKNSIPEINNNGDVILDGKTIMTNKEMTGQQESDYIPSRVDTFGNDSATLIAGQQAQDTYNSKTKETATTAGEKAYLVVKDSFSRQKPDLTNDPMWENTDNVFENLSKIAEDFAECKVEKKLVSTGKDYHVPKYETCEKLPALEESFVIGHTYDVGILRHKSGPLNLKSCGEGCTQVWIGTVGDNYWSGHCKIYEENMEVEVIQPDKISYAKLDRSKFDDYHQVYLNDRKIYNGPNGQFPPEVGSKCELSESWDIRPNVDITSDFQKVEANGTLKFKTRTSVSGEGEGYSSLLVYYNIADLIYNESWDNEENIQKAKQIKKQIDDGYCTGSITCTNMPTLDSRGCTEINGVEVCESNFKNNPMSEFGISPFCQAVKVESNCAFNEGKLCWTNVDGEEYCFDNDTQDRNTCEAYEKSETCSYIKTECVDGAQGESGACYVQEDTYDCGFDASTGTQVEEDVLTCDGQLQCIGESCVSPAKDEQNDSFGQVSAYMEMLKYARADMTCTNVPDAPYNATNTPDEYYPVPSCPEGYTYNKEGDVCLKQLSCNFTENDFYSVDLRLGTQVLKQNQVIAENPSITTCIPVIDGSYAYTCGDLQAKAGTDSFYSVCTNTTSEVVPNTCPTSTHTLKEETGLCQVPPSSSCDDGYELIQGADIWSTEDDICRKVSSPKGVCSEGETYDSATNLCSSYAEAAPTCNAGIYSNGQCISDKTECKFNERNPRSYWVSELPPIEFKRNPSLAMGSEYFWEAYWNGVRYKTADAAKSAGISSIDINTFSMDDFTGTFSYKVCKTASASSSPTCPSGYAMKDNKCVVGVTYTPKDYECTDSSMDYVPALGLCVSEVAAEPSCPTAYPVWSEEEHRCMSKSDSPLAAVQDERSFYQKNKYLIDQLLNPVGNLLAGIVSPAYADTQSAMNTYVTQGFSEGLATTSTSTEGAGVENVTCQLFEGEASECKIAVGGMQNCCKAPVTPNLGDYIKLTTSMLQLDSMTASMKLIDGYSGLWNTASDAVSGVVTKATDAVTGLFSTAADTATGTVTETATGGMVDAAAQAVMSYANDFLIDQFGPEVAQMFFQEVTKEVVKDGVTTQVTAVGPSTQMAAVGSALMYVYYAYLAYVVFTLLVNLIYACTPDEMSLAMKRELLSTHYLGSYCKTEVLGACIEKRQSYCVFDSPMSRIMMEQIYKQPQMGLSWGTAKEPNCNGLQLSDIDKVDWDQVNLDEWIGILLKSDALKAATTLDADSLTGSGSYLNSSETNPRKNVIETTIERSNNIDADEMRNDSYDSQWNSLQTPTD